MEGTDELGEDWVTEGDSFWHDGARLTPYHIRCENGDEYWRVAVEKDGVLFSRTDSSREKAIALAIENYQASMMPQPSRQSAYQVPRRPRED